MMKSATVLLFLLACIIVLVNAKTQKKAIFILAGQSNMAGRGGINYTEATPNNPTGAVWDHDIPPACQSNPHILRLDGNLSWIVAKEPLHIDIDVKKTCGVGPGMAFANEVLKRKSSLGLIGLVPCAIGGTSMADWSRGGDLYNNTMKRAMASLLRGGGKLEALLWYQGEKEAKDGVGSFATEVPKFFTSLREDLKVPHLPIIQVALPPKVVGNFTEEIRNIQLQLKLPFLRTVDAIGLELNSDDGVHLITSSQLKLGKKMAMEFLNMTT